MGKQARIRAARRASESAALPLVSCIMPTTARRRWCIPLAIRYFQRQDYPRKELIIVSDGAERIDDLIPSDERIRHIHMGGSPSLGTKRNAALEASRGDFIATWDDDDWHGPRRLSYSVRVLMTSEMDLAGQRDNLLFFDIDRQRLLVTNKGLVTKGTWRMLTTHGTTVYTRALGRSMPFPDANLGEDVGFLTGAHYREGVALLDEFWHNCTMQNHGGNTWRPDYFYDDDKINWSAIDLGRSWPALRILIGPDAEAYRRDGSACLAPIDAAGAAKLAESERLMRQLAGNTAWRYTPVYARDNPKPSGPWQEWPGARRATA